MSEAAAPDVYHLHLEGDEVPIASSALRLYLADEAHEPAIRALARDVLAGLQGPPQPDGRLVVALGPGQMKVTHSAVRLLLNDLQREQSDERDVLRAILAKLPDEHTMRAIELE